MDLLGILSQTPTTIRNVGKRIFAPSKTESSPDEPFSMLDNPAMGGPAFETLADFVSFYKNEAFQIAYSNMDPFTCYLLSLGNSWTSSAINALARPMSRSKIVPVPNDPNVVDNIEIEIVTELMNKPNPNDNSADFKYDLMWDYLATGNNYIEISYNQYGVPSALYRHLPYLITVRGNGSYQHKNGYIFAPDEMIHNKYFNPFSNKVGMSPLVPVVAATMLDESIMINSMKQFEGGPLGLLSLSDKIPSSIAVEEAKRVQAQIKKMKKNKDRGHLAAFGMTYQMMATNNREMMTPDLEKSVRTRIGAVYGVPPAKMGIIESGNLGGGTAEGQEETLNDSLDFWGNKALLASFNEKLIEVYCDFDNTHVEFKDLTKKDARKLAELDNINIRNGTTTWNRILASRGEELYDNEIADEPFVPQGLVPLSMLNAQQSQSPNVPIAKKMPISLQDKVEQILREKGNKGAYIVHYKIQQ